MDPFTTIMREAAKAALLETSIDSADLESAIELIMNSAMSSDGVKSKFAYALSDKASLTKAKGDVHMVHSGQTQITTELPSLTMPSVVRFKQRKLSVKIDHLLQPKVRELFNQEYVKEVDIEYTSTMYHDHAAAAASRKIELEICDMMVRERGANLLYRPADYTEFSVIDVGGDWRYRHVRKQFGVHIDAPFLDARDAARDTRKLMQLAKDDEGEYVCRCKAQECNVTAYAMIGVHSILYTMRNIDICAVMAKRQVGYFVGTMQLPENLEGLATTYRDEHYGYVIDMVHPADQMSGKYLPPFARNGLSKYILDNRRVKTVVYSYPNGESRVYEHEYDILVEKLKPARYMIIGRDGEVLEYDYEIVKRVGSLAYCTITLVKTEPPAHVVSMSQVIPVPKDGYLVTIDGNLLHSFMVRIGRQVEIFVPRQLFTAVATHCLTQVNNMNFTIESAISYAGSATAQYEANGVIIHAGSEDRYVLQVAVAIASFFWAFDRYRLIEARLPELSIGEVQEEVKSSIVSAINETFGIKQILESVRTAGSKLVANAAVDFALTRGTAYADLSALFQKLSSGISPGLLRIVDLQTKYKWSSELQSDGEHVQAHVASVDFVLYQPEIPIYSHEPPTKLKIMRNTMDDIRSGVWDESTVVDSLAGLTLVEPAPVQHQSTDVDDAITDMIHLAEAGEAERDQTAKDIYAQVFDEQLRRVTQIRRAKALVKGEPTVLHYLSGQLIQIQTLSDVLDKGQPEFYERLKQLQGNRCIYTEKVRSELCYGTFVLRADGVAMSDKGMRTAGQSFQALVMPDMRVRNAGRYNALKLWSQANKSEQVTMAELRNECAGSGKTHSQCKQFAEFIDKPYGQRAAIFAATKAAAEQASMRLIAWGHEFDADSVSTVDSFLMNESKWKRYSIVLVDEALQLHPGKLYAIALITGARLIGYGDRKQIGFIAFTRFHKPAVDTNYPWKAETVNLSTYRLPNCDANYDVVKWMQDDLYYGSQFKTLSKNYGGVVLYAAMTSFEKQFKLKWAYSAMGLDSVHELVILVYTQDQAERMRSQLGLTRNVPVEGSYRAAVMTIGESQGGDFDNVLLLRLATTQEPLHASIAQTLVALTRFKLRLGYLAVVSQFPSEVERLGGTPPVYPTVEAVVSSTRKIRVFKM